jgi:isfu1 transposase
MKKVDSYLVESTAVKRMIELIQGDEGVKPMKQKAAAELVLEETNVVGNGLGYRTLVRWLTHFYLYLEVPFMTRQRWGQKWAKRMHKGETKMWTREHIAKLRAIVNEDPSLYLAEMCTRLHDWDPKTLHSLSSISRTLKLIGLGRKAIYAKAAQQKEADKQTYIRVLSEALTNPEMLLMLDESNKDRTAAVRRFGWARVGERANWKLLFNCDTRYTFLGAAGCYGFEHRACDLVLHKVSGKEQSDPVDTERYVEYIRDRVVPILGNILLDEPYSVVSMDNCSIHCDSRVRELIEGAGARLIYTAPYSPEIVPIESMFHQWKAFLKKNHEDFQVDWFTVHHLAVDSITPLQGLNYFRMTTLTWLVEDHPLVVLSDPRVQAVLVVAVALAVRDER